MRLIDADAFIDELNVGVKGFEAVLSRLKTDEPVGYFHRPSVIATLKLYEIIKEYIEKQPTVETPRGEWIMHDDEILGLSCECSACHIETLGNPKFCPNCGADMRGVE